VCAGERYPSRLQRDRQAAGGGAEVAGGALNTCRPTVRERSRGRWTTGHWSKRKRAFGKIVHLEDDYIAVELKNGVEIDGKLSDFQADKPADPQIEIGSDYDKIVRAAVDRVHLEQVAYAFQALPGLEQEARLAHSILRSEDPELAKDWEELTPKDRYTVVMVAARTYHAQDYEAFLERLKDRHDQIAQEAVLAVSGVP